MRNVNLSNKDLTDTILTGADLTGADLTGVDTGNTIATQETEDVEMYDNRVRNTFWETLGDFIVRNFNNFVNLILN